MKKNSKLFSPLNDFYIYDYYSLINDKIKVQFIESLPFLTYPNGLPCYEANSYLLYKLKLGYSQKNGGSYRIFANHLTHFIRFTFRNKYIKNFSQYDNSLFSIFLDSLQDNDNIRSNNQIIRIAYQVIDFLFYISRLYNLEYFIGIGNAYKISLISRKTKRTNSRYKFESTYFHPSFPPSSSYKKRYPVSLNDYNKLLAFLNKNNNEALRLRNLCLIQALENTGGRRTEVCSLSLEALKTALKSSSSSPLLELINLKSIHSKKSRLVPVSRNFLLNLKFYIQYYRNPIMKKKNIHHDFIFISHTTGEPLKPDSLTVYMNNWSLHANLSTIVCAHMFRHRFITEKFKALILEHNLSHIDEFRKILLNTNRLKQIMLEWTGHSSIESLDNYINLAFEELIEVDKVKNKILVNSSIYFMDKHINNLEKSLDNNLPIDKSTLRELLSQLRY